MSPTQSRIPADRYTDPAAFAAECRQIFRRTWVYLGLKVEFGAEPKPVEIGGGSVMVARDGAGFALTDGACAGRVETFGALVFGCFDAAAPPLATRFAPYGDMLRAIGERLHSIEHREVTPVAANWKLVIENTLDDYHVPQVHPTSFQPPLDDWRQHMRYERPGGPSRQIWDMRDEAVANWARMDRRLRFDRHGDDAGYRHLYLFPCLYISTVYSGFVVLHRLIPQAVDRTLIEWTLCLPLAPPISPARATMRGAVIQDLANGARRVIGEDVRICDLAQRGRYFPVHPPIYGAREARLVDYETELLGSQPTGAL